MLVKLLRQKKPIYPIYQCVDGEAHTDIIEIQNNLIKHITHPVLWTSMVHNMVRDDVSSFYEVGTDDTLQKIILRMFPEKKVGSLSEIDNYKGIITNYKI